MQKIIVYSKKYICIWGRLTPVQSNFVVEYCTVRYLGNVKEIYFEINKNSAYRNISRTERESCNANSSNS